MLHPPIQFDHPVFVRIPFDSHSRSWKKGQHYPWLEMGIDKDKVLILYNNGFIHHNSDLEAEHKDVGDGLDLLDIEQLHALVETINDIVKAKTKNESEFKKMKCAKSKIPDKQRGMIRRWRNIYGHLEN